MKDRADGPFWNAHFISNYFSIIFNLSEELKWERKNILISAYLDLSSYQKKSWTYIVFVERNILYLLSREDIDDIKYEVPNYNIYLKNIGVCKSYTIKMNVDTFKTEEEKEWEFK